VSAFSAISWRVQVNFQSDDDDQVRCVLNQHAYWLFIILAHWKKISPRVEMSLHSDTLS